LMTAVVLDHLNITSKNWMTVCQALCIFLKKKYF
jgi:hypothetical protein